MCERMLWPHGGTRFLRDRTSRGNIAYGFRELPREGARAELIAADVKSRLDSLPDDRLVIVYCATINKGKAVSQHLGSPFFHRQSKEKSAILAAFRGSGANRVVVASSALGLGFDEPRVGAVVHADIPYSLIEYAQESGRAGRDGVASQAVILASPGWQHTLDRFDTGKQSDAALVDFLLGTQYRRAPLNKHLDGRERLAGCEDGEEQCDVYLHSAHADS